MPAFNQGRDNTRALPPFTFGGENDGRPWVMATKYERENFITRAQLRTLIKHKKIWAFRHKNRIYVKPCNPNFRPKTHQKGITQKSYS